MTGTLPTTDLTRRLDISIWLCLIAEFRPDIFRALSDKTERGAAETPTKRAARADLAEYLAARLDGLPTDVLARPAVTGLGGETAALRHAPTPASQRQVSVTE